MSTTAYPRRPALARGRGGRALNLGRFRGSAPLIALLGLTAALYLWTLSRNGYANTYYAAAVQAGTHSWKAFLFGSLDASNYITVDKPPASLWLMELSSRLFGFSSFSMLLPQALEGVASVALLYATVRRWFGRRAALLSGLILALTPVAALMFRFNNPDALLVLLLIAAAYALTRALESGATRWLALTGAALGFAFLTKELQAFVLLPPFALAYLVAAPVPLRRRLWQLAVGGAALVLSAGWWVALVELWPAASRPYIGDSTSNSILQVIFGSNGLDRISSGGFGAGPGGGFSGSAGILRLFNSEMGGQISWLLPAAAIALVTGAVWSARRPREIRLRQGLLLWGGWFVITAAVFSFMTGIIHPYYTNMLAPAIAVLVGVGATLLWRRRERLPARLILAAMCATTAVWAYALLTRTPDWYPWLRFAILAGGLAAAIGIVAAERLGNDGRRALVLLGLAATLAAPTAYTLSTASTAQAGGDPLAGPATASLGGFPGGGGGQRPAFAGGSHGPVGGGQTVSRSVTSLLKSDSSHYTWVAAADSSQTAASLQLSSGQPVMAIGGFGGTDPAITLAGFEKLVSEGKIHYYVSGGGFGGGGFPGGRAFPGAAGLAQGSEVRGGGEPPQGGALGGTAPAGLPGAASGGLPLPQGGGAGPQGFGGRFGPGRSGAGTSVASRIQTWVSKHFTSKTVGGMTIYNLTQPKDG